MLSILPTIIGIIFGSIVVLLCFSSCVLASKADDFWEETKKKMEKDNERH